MREFVDGEFGEIDGGESREGEARSPRFVKFFSDKTAVKYSTINFELVEPQPEEYLVSNGTSFKSIADAEKHLLSMGVNTYKISKVIKKVEVIKIVRDLE